MKHSIKNSVISGTGLLLAISLFIATIILANTAFTTWRIDLTENKLFTLSKGTKNILNNLDEPVQLDFYFSQKAMNDFPLHANYRVRVRDMLEELTAHANRKLILKFIRTMISSSLSYQTSHQRKSDRSMEECNKEIRAGSP